MHKQLLGAAVSLGMIAGASGVAHAQAKKVPAPGTLVVHLDGMIDAQMNGIWTSVDHVGGWKLDPIGMAGEFRIYPGFDATTTNGLEYGASAETRVAYTAANTGQHEAAPGAESMTVRRAWVYFGTPQFGFIRAGQTDGAWELLSVGEYYNWGDHNAWNSDGGVGAAVPGAAHPSALFTYTGALYTTNKIVYLSPKFMGLEAGVSFEPNSNAFKEGQSCSFAGAAGYSGCATVSSGPGAGDVSRRRDTYEISVAYSTKMDDFGVKLNGAYLGATPALRGTTDYRPLSVGQIGAQVTYAGFLLGANVKFGQANNGYHFLAPGARNVLFYNLTGEYSVGPLRLAVNYFANQAAGAWAAGNGVDRTETDYGIGVGANYGLAKGVDLYAMYLYGHRHQSGFDFVSGTPGTAYNDTNANAFTVGTVVTW